MSKHWGRDLYRVWLLGCPVGHSLSPLLHNLVYRELSIPCEYAVREVSPQDWEAVLGELSRDRSTLGCNVTVPHKERAWQYYHSLGLVSPQAEAVRSVNTICLASGVPKGSQDGDARVYRAFSTDGPGWLMAWDEQLALPFQGREALILGAGGAAKAIVGALLARGVSRVEIWNRHPERAQELADGFGERVSAVSQVSLREDLLVVQATSVGMWPRVNDTVWTWPAVAPRGVVACDLVYNPQETLFLSQAFRAGARIMGGLDMLINQAALSIELWWGVLPDRELRTAMKKAALSQNKQN